MAALFGPLGAASAAFADPSIYSGAAWYPGAPSATAPAWWQTYLQPQAARLGGGGGNPYYPVYPVYPAPPPVRNRDVPLPNFGPPPAAGLTGSQTTRPDRLFGPFARLAGRL